MSGLVLIVTMAIFLVLGFILGWLAEWYIDVAYRQTRELRAALERKRPTGKEEDKHKEGEGSEEAPVLIALRQERDRESQRLQAEIEAGEAELAAYMRTHPDDLTNIKGIGPTYQSKLHNAGITTYAQLAQATPELLQQIINAPNWRKPNAESWIEQARLLSQRG
jgi:predicted flap endonuclease-1-like 5' DNA nuclease